MSLSSFFCKKLNDFKYYYPLQLGVVAIEKGAFWSPSTMIANFTYYVIFSISPQYFVCKHLNRYTLYVGD